MSKRALTQEIRFVSIVALMISNELCHCSFSFVLSKSESIFFFFSMTKN